MTLLKRKIPVVLFCLLSAYGYGQLNMKSLKKAKDKLVQPKSTGLSNEEIIEGLKEALSVGAKNSSAMASKVDGFYKNDLIFIPFPEEALKVKNAAEKDREKKVNRFALINKEITGYWEDYNGIFEKVCNYQVKQLNSWKNSLESYEQSKLIKIAHWLDVRNPENSDREDATKMLSNGIAIPDRVFKELTKNDKIRTLIYKNNANKIKLLDNFYQLEKPNASTRNRIIAEHTRDKLLALIAEEYFKKIYGSDKMLNVSLVNDSYQEEEVIFLLKNYKKISFTYSKFKQVRSRESFKHLPKIALFNEFKDKNCLSFSKDISPLLEQYKTSQREYMKKIFELEERVIKEKKLTPNTEGYIPFKCIVTKLEIENKEKELIRNLRNDAFHSEMKHLSDANFFQTGMKWIDT